MTQATNIQPGTKLIYRAMSGELRTVVVEAHYDDIKNGRPGFDAVMVGTGEDVWGYDADVVRVLS